ncbi:MAG: hypothetical protein QF704_06970 [Anaerolineales bacterium]|nr:hypothetical protein [Anaerolineales bacterium]
MATDHLNVVERELIDNLRTGTYSGGTAWSSGDVTVFGQFPETEDIKYPCIIVQMLANGIEEQFMGQAVSSGSSTVVGELYGIGFNMNIAVDKESSITVDGTPYKQRRLLNYLMINCANVLMDCDFTNTDTEVVQRLYTGFRNVGYEPMLEVWAAMTGMILIFKNTRG